MDTEGERVEKKLVIVVIEEEGHNVPVPELEKERLDVPDTLTDTEREYVFEVEALTLPVVDEERHNVAVPEVVGEVDEERHNVAVPEVVGEVDEERHKEAVPEVVDV